MSEEKEPFKDGIYQYSMILEGKKLSSAVTQSYYCGAPTKKVKSDIFYNHVNLSYHLASCNTLVSVLTYITEVFEQGLDKDLIIGDLQVALKKNWDVLSTHKIGMGTFKKMDISNIVNTKHPAEYLKNGVKFFDSETKKKLNKTIENGWKKDEPKHDI